MSQLSPQSPGTSKTSTPELDRYLTLLEESRCQHFVTSQADDKVRYICRAPVCKKRLLSDK